MTRSGKILSAAQAALFLSGAASLIYQSLWLRSFGLVFGNTTTATSLVLAVFMGGLALGGHLSRKWQFKNSLRAYAVLELLMALFAAGGRLLLTWMPSLYGSLLGGAIQNAGLELALKMVLAAAITLPTAACAGMTLPVMTECLKRRGQASPKIFAVLYRVNTLGAAFGTVACAYFLIPATGTLTTYLAAVVANLIVGVTAWAISRAPELSLQPPISSKPVLPTYHDTRLPWLAFGSGFSAFLLEVVWVRSLVLVIGSSTYSFSIMLCSVLLGIALGAWVYQRFALRLVNDRNWMGRAFLLLGFLILVSYTLIGRLPSAYVEAVKAFSYSFGTLQVVSFLLCFLVLLLVTALQGFLFPALLQLRQGNETVGQERVGELYFWNTLGALAGSMAAGLFLIPWMGFQAVYFLAAATAAGMGFWFFTPSLEKTAKIVSLAAALALLFGIGMVFHPWNQLLMTAGVYEKDREKISQMASLDQYQTQNGDSLLYYKEGRETVVTVKRLKDGHTIMANNGKLEAGDGEDLSTQKLSAHIPLACSPKARKVFLIGWGSGSTAGTLSLYPVEEIHCVEIEPKVYDTASCFKDINYEVWKDPRFNIHLKDARNDLLASPALYDLIVSEPSNLWVPGVSSLFTTEFYQLAQSRLTEDGVFAQWFPFFSMNLKDIQTQIRTLCRVFPHTQMWLLPDLRKRFAALTGGLLLMGSKRDLTMDYAAAEALFRDKRIVEDFAKIGVDGPWPLLSMQWLDEKQMTAFAGEGPVNTDAFPRLEYSGPRSHYRTRIEENQSILEIFSAISRCRLNLFPELLNSPLEDARVSKKKRTDAMTLLAVTYARLGRFTDSLNVIQRIRTLGFNSYEITYLRGKDLVFSGQDIAGGIEELRAALKMKPDEKNLLTNIGLLLIKTGKSGEAFELFQKAAKKWPGEQGFVFGQGLSKFYSGDLDASRFYLGDVLRMNPNHPWAGVLMACVQSRVSRSPQSDNFLNLALQP